MFLFHFSQEVLSKQIKILVFLNIFLLVARKTIKSHICAPMKQNVLTTYFSSKDWPNNKLKQKNCSKKAHKRKNAEQSALIAYIKIAVSFFRMVVFSIQGAKHYKDQRRDNLPQPLFFKKRLLLILAKAFINMTRNSRK